MRRHEDDENERTELDDERHPLRHLRFFFVGRILVDELAVDVAGVEIGRRDRHDRRRHQRADADSGKGDADEPRREAVQEQRRHREVVAELLEAGGVFGKAADAGGDGEEADEGEKTKHEGIARQHRGVAADGVAAGSAQYAGHGMRVEEQRQRRAERQGYVDAVGARRVGSGNGQQQFLRRHRREDFAKAAEFDRDDDHRGEGRDVDQNILDDRDRRRRP